MADPHLWKLAVYREQRCFPNLCCGAVSRAACDGSRRSDDFREPERKCAPEDGIFRHAPESGRDQKADPALCAPGGSLLVPDGGSGGASCRGRGGLSGVGADENGRAGTAFLYAGLGSQPSGHLRGGGAGRADRAPCVTRSGKKSHAGLSHGGGANGRPDSRERKARCHGAAGKAIFDAVEGERAFPAVSSESGSCAGHPAGLSGEKRLCADERRVCPLYRAVSGIYHRRGFPGARPPSSSVDAGAFRGQLGQYLLHSPFGGGCCSSDGRCEAGIRTHVRLQYFHDSGEDGGGRPDAVWPENGEPHFL